MRLSHSSRVGAVRVGCWGPLLLLIAATALIVLYANDAFVRQVWTRDHPLTNPVAVTSVRDGVLTMADGRMLRPAGIRRRDSVSAGEYDAALRAIVNQGVVVTRDLGDGRALLRAEPKFWNWCGTHNGWTHWAGTYLQCPVSELLIFSAYADPDVDAVRLDQKERWRIEGAVHLNEGERQPTPIHPDGTKLRFDGGFNLFNDYDVAIEAVWKPPPDRPTR